MYPPVLKNHICAICRLPPQRVMRNIMASEKRLVRATWPTSIKICCIGLSSPGNYFGQKANSLSHPLALLTRKSYNGYYLHLSKEKGRRYAMRCVFVINPIAGKADASVALLPRIRAAADRVGIEPTVPEFSRMIPHIPAKTNKIAPMIAAFAECFRFFVILRLRISENTDFSLKLTHYLVFSIENRYKFVHTNLCESVSGYSL